jgi:exosortase A
MATTTNARELTTLLLMAGVAAAVGIVYSESVRSLIAVWNLSAYNHGFVVFPIAAYLLWRLRGPLATESVAPSPIGVLFVAALVLLWVIGRRVGIQLVEHFAVVLLVPTTIATCLGWKVTRRALFPLLFLVVAVPFGELLVPLLTRVTADIASGLLRLVGVPVFRDREFLTLPGGEFEVADVCSGLRYLTAGTMIALLFSYLTYQNQWKRCLFVVMTGFGLIAVNGLRAFVIMDVASATHMRWLAGRDHIYFGWLLFALAFAVWFAVGARYADSPQMASSESAGKDLGVLPMVIVSGLLMLAITAKPLQGDFGGGWLLVPVAGVLFLLAMSRALVPRVSTRSAESGPGRWQYARATATVLITATVLVGGVVAADRSADGQQDVSTGFELPEVAGCSMSEPRRDSWLPTWPSPDFGGAAAYDCGERSINAFVAGYTHNVQGRELVNEELRIIPESARRSAVESKAQFSSRAGISTEVNEVRAEFHGSPALIWYWYSVGDRSATSPAVAKLLQALQLILAGRSDGTLYWIQTSVDASLEVSRAHLTRVAAALAAAGPVRSRSVALQ